MIKFFKDFWNWIVYDLFDKPILCIRRDFTYDGKVGPSTIQWCSPEYLSYILGIDLIECRVFIEGPENSKECGLYMNRDIRKIFCTTDMTRAGEENDNEFIKFSVDRLNLRTGESLKPIDQRGDIIL